MDGLTFKQEVAVIINISDIGEPSFCEVTDIFISGTSVRLNLLELDTVEFNHHYHSWIVEKTEKRLVKKIKELASTQILPLRPARYHSEMLYYVTLKYTL